MPHALTAIIVRRVDHESYVFGYDSCATEHLYDHGMPGRPVVRFHLVGGTINKMCDSKVM
jgi:hypothetical protein